MTPFAERTLLAAWLRAIPQSRHAPRPLAALPGHGTLGLGLAQMLAIWGAVELSPAGIRAVSQPAYYFLHSLAAWAELPAPVVTDWSEQLGAMPGQGLRHGTTLVHMLEAARQASDPGARAIRYTPVAQTLIIQGAPTPRFLCQWDERAGAFQIIGGRQKYDLDWVEPIDQTAIREVEEELGGQVRYAAGDFQVEHLATFTGETRLSPSFGALTAYRFSFFRITHLKAITIGPNDRWLSRVDLQAGITSDGQPVRGDHLPHLEGALGFTLEQLPSSFRGDER